MTICYIENVSKTDVKQGFHSNLGPNSMLIQIADPAEGFPTPYSNFKEVHQFEFLDAEDTEMFPEDCLISQEQASKIVGLLQHALDNNMNVLVHCHAGVCRSGAVVEVGSLMGFTHTGRGNRRIPNLRAKRLMFRALGWGYEQEQYEADTKCNKTKLGWNSFDA